LTITGNNIKVRLMKIDLIPADRSPLGQPLYVVRDDLYPLYYGGNKARKMVHIIREIEEGLFDAVVTTGGIQSNHCRVVALACAERGWKCKLVLHGSREQFLEEKGNALLMRRSGADLEFVEGPDIGPAMDRCMEELKAEGKRPYYLYGGGHNRSGVLAYREAMQEFKELWPEDAPPAHVFLASGTGSTQGGLLAGCGLLNWTSTHIRGISVARTKERGQAAILESLSFVDESPESYQDRLHFEDRYTFGGYGLYTRELSDFTVRMARETGLILDPTYSGKAFYGMLDLISREQLKGSLVFWHTGGLLNLMY
jgi:D-cysteine desulfhydrase